MMRRVLFRKISSDLRAQSLKFVSSRERREANQKSSGWLTSFPPFGYRKGGACRRRPATCPDLKCSSARAPNYRALIGFGGQHCSPCKKQGDHLCVSPGRCRVQRSLVSRPHVGKRPVLEEKSNSRHVAPPGGVNKWALGPHGIGHEVRVRPGLQAGFDPFNIAVLGLLQQGHIGIDWRSRRERRTVARPAATSGHTDANDERQCFQLMLNWVDCHGPLGSPRRWDILRWSAIRSAVIMRAPSRGSTGASVSASPAAEPASP